MSLYIKENLINRDENYQFEESDVYDTGLDTKGDDFATLNWPTFDRLIWPTPDD